jgi:3,4-dihydroxy 2-butanone 4-phosphate synthase / GTP cyclohydrolase II
MSDADLIGLHLDSIDDALAAIAKGESVIVMDDHNRENEGDLVMAAQFATPEALAFIIRHTTGIVCVGLEAERVETLDLPPMVPSNSDRHQTAFTVSVDFRRGTTTGVSAADRTKTILALADETAVAGDFMRPGHVFPLRARSAGVLERAGHTEAAVDLTRLAGCYPAGVICEIMNEDGTMARLPELLVFARKHGLKIITIADLIRYRRCSEDMGIGERLNVRTASVAH